MPTTPTPTQTPKRSALRLRLGEPGVKQALDGAWWPQSRDLTVELRDLVDHFPRERGRITRALVSPPDWDATPPRVPVRHGYVRVGVDRHDDTHVVVLTLSDRTGLCLLVVPPGFSPADGHEALLASTTPRYASSASALLAHVLDQPAADPDERWNDEGGSWWGADDDAPSYRNEA
jgi:hypothetical protein